MTELYPDTARRSPWTGREDYRVLRSDVTGAGHYRFFRNDRLIGTANALVLPDWPLVINCGAMVFNSTFRRETTVFPGCCREIIDADNPCDTAAKLVWLGDGSFELQVNFSSGPLCLQILSTERTHLFFRDGEPIARITPPENTRHQGEWEPHLRMECCEEVSDDLAVLMLSYPLLRFAI